MSSYLKIFRRAKTLLWTALSIVIISSAVLVGLGELLMPYSAQYKPRLEAWLSKEFGRPVVVESFSGEWRAFGPQLTISGMRLPSADGQSGDVLIEEAVIDIKPLSALMPSSALYDFRVVGAGFHLVRLADGSFELSGLGVTRKPGDRARSGVRQIARIGQVLLENSSLYFDDEVNDIHIGFHSIDAMLEVQGDQLAAELTAQLADRNNPAIYGDLEATVVMALDDEQQLESMAWQLSGQELMLDRLRSKVPQTEYFPSQGKLTTEIWGEWESGQTHSLKGVVDLRDARFVTEHLDRKVQHLNTRFKLSFSDLHHWRVDLDGFQYQGRKSDFTVNSFSIGRQMSDGIGLWLTADAIPSATPMDIAHDVFAAIGRPWPKYLPGAGVGTVQEFEMILNDNMKMHFASGYFNNSSVSDWRIWPDIEGIDGRMQFGPGHGTISVSGKGIGVTWPRMFSQPMEIDVPQCDINFAWGGGEWQVLIDTCESRNEYFASHGVMRFKDIKNSDGKPTVDINVYADRLDLSRAGPYWPRALLKERVVGWLEEGLKAGEVGSTRLLIRGDMDDWPFDHGEGRFEVSAQVENGDLFYFPGWPRAREFEGLVTFEGTGMNVEGLIGNIAGVSVDLASAQIEDFRTPLLKVDFESNTSLPAVIGFVADSPIQAAIDTDLERFGISGRAFVTGALEVPLKQDSPGLTVKGVIDVEDGEFSADNYGFSLQGINGALQYDSLGLFGKELSASYKDKPAVLEFRAGRPGVEITKIVRGAGLTSPSQWPENESLRATLSGDFAPVDFLGEEILETWAPLRKIKGASEWSADFTVSAARDDSVRGQELVLRSDLEGISIDLPEPLSKAETASWPIEIHVPLGEEKVIATMSVADRVSAAARIDGLAGRAAGVSVEFGKRPPSVPIDGALVISGATGTLDLDEWVKLVLDEARSDKNLAGLQIQPGSLSAENLIFLDREFAQVDTNFESNGSTLIADFDAEEMRGNVQFTHSTTGTHNLTAEFERLALDKPLSSGMEMDVDPTSLPNLHLYAKSFRYAGIELGETRIEAYPESDGFRFETVDARSPHMSVRASGNWYLREGSHRSEFDIHMTSESLGDFLRQLEFSSPVEGGQTLVEFGVWWEGSPGQFGLARLNGDVDFTVNTGVITDAKPGSGRLLGLLSVQSLPRRLALDFRDVFDSGFAFDEANGTFRMENGSASTDDVVLRSSAANISLSGTTDLVERQYDQVITVRPGLGNTLPVIGAIAGGPGGAAAGLALQGLLHDQLGEASQVQYTITGAWDEPLIEPIIKARNDGP